MHCDGQNTSVSLVWQAKQIRGRRGVNAANWLTSCECKLHKKVAAQVLCRGKPPTHVLDLAFTAFGLALPVVWAFACRVRQKDEWRSKGQWRNEERDKGEEEETSRAV
jgi:hypothetical protein